jgi:hypothetical protein
MSRTKSELSSVPSLIRSPPSALGSSPQIHCLGRGPSGGCQGDKDRLVGSNSAVQGGWGCITMSTVANLDLRAHADHAGSSGSCRAKARQVRVHCQHLRDIRAATAAPAHEVFPAFFRRRSEYVRTFFLRLHHSRSRVAGWKRVCSGPGTRFPVWAELTPSRPHPAFSTTDMSPAWISSPATVPKASSTSGLTAIYMYRGTWRTSISY